MNSIICSLFNNYITATYLNVIIAAYSMLAVAVYYEHAATTLKYQLPLAEESSLFILARNSGI